MGQEGRRWDRREGGGTGGEEVGQEGRRWDRREGGGTGGKEDGEGDSDSSDVGVCGGAVLSCVAVDVASRECVACSVVSV